MKEDYFMINHVKKNIKWDRFIFYGYNKNKPHRFVWCTLEDMKKCWEETNFWSNQVVQKNLCVLVKMLLNGLIQITQEI